MCLIRTGTPEDINELEKLYNNLNDYLGDTVNYPGWKKGVYPTREDAENGVRDSSLFVAMQDGVIVGSLILTQKQEEPYLPVKWTAPLEDNEVFVIHTSGLKNTGSIGTSCTKSLYKL